MGQHEDEAAESRHPCREMREWLLAETIRLRDRLRISDPTGQRLPIAGRDVARQCRELGIPYVA